MPNQTKGWQFIKYETFVDIFPLEDIKDHGLGDECWCEPQVRREAGFLPMITHNSADRRELSEPDHFEELLLWPTVDQ